MDPSTPPSDSRLRSVDLDKEYSLLPPVFRASVSLPAWRAASSQGRVLARREIKRGRLVAAANHTNTKVRKTLTVSLDESKVSHDAVPSEPAVPSAPPGRLIDVVSSPPSTRTRRLCDIIFYRWESDGATNTLSHASLPRRARRMLREAVVRKKLPRVLTKLVKFHHQYTRDQVSSAVLKPCCVTRVITPTTISTASSIIPVESPATLHFQSAFYADLGVARWPSLMGNAKCNVSITPSGAANTTLPMSMATGFTRPVQ